MYLRLYLGAKLHSGASFPPNDRRSLGALTSECEKNGFDPAVIKKIRTFNDQRIKGVHHYLLGAASYESLRGVCEDSTNLMIEILDVITAELGRRM